MFALELLLTAADNPAPSSSDSPIIVILGLAVAALGTIGTALGPVILEMVKGRTARRSGAHSAQPVVAPALSAQLEQTAAERQLSHEDKIIQEAVEDYRKQRDEAMTHYYATLDALDRARSVINQQSVVIARMQAEMSRNPGYPSGTPNDQNWEQR